MRTERPSFYVDPLELAQGKEVIDKALGWASEQLGSGPILIYATSDPNRVKRVQLELGIERAGEIVENALAAIARGLVNLGVGQLIVAGGETSGSVVNALGVKGLRIGPEIDPGVPWTTTLSETPQPPPLALALKSGNFGTQDFFAKAWKFLP
jgi:uncharacterized protein YgbK (DUF1537 family)